VIDLLAAQQAALREIAGIAAPDAAAPLPASSPPPQAASSPSPAPSIEVAEGAGISVHFEARRCIHSRHCVLDAPSVFKANTPGEWIFPDTMPVEDLVDVSLNCPSGAITFT